MTPEREREIRKQCMRKWKPHVDEMRELLAELDRVRLQDRKYQFIDDMLGDACRRGKLLETERDQLREKLEIAMQAFEHLQKFTRPVGVIKTTIEAALAKIRGEK